MSSKTIVATERRGIRQSFWFHLLLILVLCAVLYVLFFSSLGLLTRHGDDVKVPSVIGKDVKTAVTMLHGMGFDVEVDSTYEPEQKSQLVLRQSPDVGEIVKNGRTLYLTVNKSEPPVTPVPNLVGFTFRSAVLVLKSNRLLLGDTTYKPDIGIDNVLEVLYKGVPIRPGMLIPQGSKISFVLGSGLGDQVISVPDVTGMTFAEAKETLAGSSIQSTDNFDDVITDTASSKVYSQVPNAINELGSPNNIRAGDYVELHFKMNPSQEEIDSIKNAGRIKPIKANDTAQ